MNIMCFFTQVNELDLGELDTVTVYDYAAETFTKTPIATFRGSESPPIRSATANSGAMLVVMDIRSEQPGSGFAFEYYLGWFPCISLSVDN